MKESEENKENKELKDSKESKDKDNKESKDSKTSRKETQNEKKDEKKIKRESQTITEYKCTDGIKPTLTLSCYLFQDRDEEKTLKAESMALMTAVQKNNLSLVLYCLEHFKNDVNKKDSQGNTALHSAAKMYHNEYLILSLLKNANVDVNTENLDKNTPFHFFCSSFRNPNCEEAFNMFMKRSVDVNVKNKTGETPLHRAIQNPSIRMLLVELLLKNGADVNHKTNQGHTALHWAVFMKRIDLLSILLLYGADINIPNKKNETPYSICKTNPKYKDSSFARTFNYILDLIKYLKDINAEANSIKILVLNKYFKWKLNKVTPRVLFGLGITDNTEQMKLVKNFKMLKEVDPEIKFREEEEKKRKEEEEKRRKEMLEKGIQEEKIGWIRKKETCEYTNTLRKVEFGTLYTAFIDENNTNEMIIRTFEQLNLDVKIFNMNSTFFSSLENEHLPKYQGVIEEEKAIIMSKYEGVSLNEYMKNNQSNIGWKQVFDISLQIIDGIMYLHKNNILHRNLKDTNILIHKIDENDENLHITIHNFGLKELGVDNNAIKKSNNLYIAPEILQYDLYSEKSDVYSFCLLLWQLVFRCIYGSYSSPFEEYLGSMRETQILQQIQNDTLVPTIPPTIPRILSNMLQLCLQKEPSSRHPFNELKSIIVECEKDYNANKTNWDSSIDVK